MMLYPRQTHVNYWANQGLIKDCFGTDWEKVPFIPISPQSVPKLSLIWYIFDLS